MYFPFLELQKWHKRSAEIRRRNCAVLPYVFPHPPGNWFVRKPSPLGKGNREAVEEVPRPHELLW